MIMSIARQIRNLYFGGNDIVIYKVCIKVSWCLLVWFHVVYSNYLSCHLADIILQSPKALLWGLPTIWVILVMLLSYLLYITCIVMLACQIDYLILVLVIERYICTCSYHALSSMLVVILQIGHSILFIIPYIIISCYLSINRPTGVIFFSELQLTSVNTSLKRSNSLVAAHTRSLGLKPVFLGSCQS